MDMCYECGAPNSLTVSTEIRPYLEDAGLRIQIPQNVSTCSECGAEHVGIQNIQGLHDQIATAIINSPSRLRGPEIRFLRKHLGWSGEDFARFFQVSPSTVSRWENGKQDLGTQGDLLLRMCVSQLDPVGDYSLHDAPRLEKSEISQTRIFVSSTGKWSPRPR